MLPTVESSSTIPSLGEIGLAHFVPYLLNRISACWNANMQETLKGLDMTTTKMRILAILSVMPGLTINELSVHAITEQSTMSRTLDALEEQNYIRRQARTDDMRVREIYITDEGRSLFARIWPPMYEIYSHLFEGVDETELRALIGTLHKILHNTRKQDL
ncbi:MarR family winged helix-turn-helix transcriptional regulator [Microvirga yunnanensis]|uniref:MarR family winged helix-turn-helix transcriptional regulator n=1 Tax=Microvirga yunnanensis TaxID=2953740 RepID=UPI0021CA1F74|nr:MarR family transcriptional regulator [Microvirga sp. HBU65207]